MDDYAIRLILIALWALIPGFIARHKGRSFFGYFFLSFLITPILCTVIILCLKRIVPDDEESNPTQSNDSNDK